MYNEYCVAELDKKRFEEQSLRNAGQTIPPRTKRSTAKFLVNISLIALHSTNSRHARDMVDKSNWTADGHDIRFIVRLVQAGRYPGRWWEHRRHPRFTAELCSIVYRLMCCLRFIHRLSTAQVGAPSCNEQSQGVVFAVSQRTRFKAESHGHFTIIVCVMIRSRMIRGREC